MANPIVTGYSVNDYFYTHTESDGLCYGYTGDSNNTEYTDCATNQKNATTLIQAQTNSSAAQSQYQDTIMLYNRELIITVNLILGVCGLMYYIYINKDVLPAIPTSLPELKMPDIKMPEIPQAFPVMNVTK
jgi:hypothetical protein